VLLGLPEFEFHSSDTLEEASALLSKYGADARLLAGGTDLLILMKHRKEVPRHLINIKRIPGLDLIRDDQGRGLRIGALATARAIMDAPAIGKTFTAVAVAASKLGTSQIRNLGTIGGNLGNASPSAEFAPPLLTLGASVECAGANGARAVPIEEFFVAPGRSCLAHDEVVSEVVVPPPPDGAEGIYLKHSLRRMDVAMVAAAVLVVLDGDVCREVRIALGAVAPTPFRAAKAEAALRGQRLAGGVAEDGLLDAVGQIASDESSPIDDIRGYAEYRRKVIKRLVAQGLGEVIARART
jgi:carbon-monoxide dehydrogenase medium subunit